MLHPLDISSEESFLWSAEQRCKSSATSMENSSAAQTQEYWAESLLQPWNQKCSKCWIIKEIDYICVSRTNLLLHIPKLDSQVSQQFLEALSDSAIPSFSWVILMTIAICYIPYLCDTKLNVIIIINLFLRSFFISVATCGAPQGQSGCVTVITILSLYCPKARPLCLLHSGVTQLSLVFHCLE